MHEPCCLSTGDRHHSERQCGQFQLLDVTDERAPRYLDAQDKFGHWHPFPV
jgi:hypothetical protein